MHLQHLELQHQNRDNLRGAHHPPLTSFKIPHLRPWNTPFSISLSCCACFSLAMLFRNISRHSKTKARSSPADRQTRGASTGGLLEKPLDGRPLTDLCLVRQYHLLTLLCYQGYRSLRIHTSRPRQQTLLGPSLLRPAAADPFEGERI